jgi:serine/threonine-protein kinase RsbW
LNAKTTIPARLSRLTSMLRWVRKELQKFGLHEGSVRRIELAAEEALVNIIHHAYRDLPGDIEIHVARDFRKGRIEIMIRDQGPPFNPLNKKGAFESSLSRVHKIGGLGLLFIRQYVDEVQYERQKETNILTLSMIETRSEMARN